MKRKFRLAKTDFEKVGKRYMILRFSILCYGYFSAVLQTIPLSESRTRKTLSAKFEYSPKQGVNYESNRNCS